MAIARPVTVFLALMAGSLLVSGCQTEKEVASAPLINGKWRSTDNVYTADFSNGTFLATANDTGGIISEGNYILEDDDKVRIEWIGRVSGQPNSANCTKSGDNRLDCVDRNGSRFSLVRTTTG